MKKIKLTIITVNYNSAKLVEEMVESVKKSQNINFGIKIIVVDNSDEDFSKVPGIIYLKNPSGNAGFSSGNNLGLTKADGEYVWFINPDIVLEPKTISYMIDYMDKHPEVGVATPKLVLKTGEFDKNCHRGFPSLWNSLCHFLYLDKAFPTSRIFAGYYLGHLKQNEEADVDVVGGSSLLVRRTLGDKIGWWDRDYFMYGEDIEFTWQIKQLGYAVRYVPQVFAWHHHGIISGLKKNSLAGSTATRETKIRSVKATVEAMRIFYRKHHEKNNNFFINYLVYLGMWLLEKIRLITLSA